jgi:hypothetical protein
MEPTKEEIALSCVLAFLEELETGILPSYYKNGYSDKVFGKGNGKQIKKLLDLSTDSLCRKLSSLTNKEILQKSLNKFHE